MPERKPLSRAFIFIIISFAGIILGTWLYFSPPGLLGKADAIGYAVCHRIPERSFHLDDRPVPMCARCSGMYLGAFTGILLQLRSGKRGGFPARKFIPIMVAFVLAFGFDGVNSYLHFFQFAPHLYQPQNWLRLLTGTGMGINIALIVYPTVNQTLWKEYSLEPVFSRWRDFGLMILAALLVSAAAYSENILLLYPLAIISSLTVLAILTGVYSILWTLVLKRENAFSHWKEAIPVFACGFTTALFQIAVFDLVRFLLTGTWSSFL